ncbi:DNA polymerase III subunit chi [Limimaricola cinnabarinus]|jgi:DNA polymerase-3 subunit chi|uniref:DNA polymerase III chi subunit n=1 Tax=Limimaricola cinnabarinus LL-001 TaxID=1337093 RepID=U2Z1D4_9RHOB|nr:DNA polymerase III subunit chi [Limimaricola cinnabarinus]GAD54872.1 DNA polymerase III chi subunit [Limimaricola cinnabarinus LL-001]
MGAAFFYHLTDGPAEELLPQLLKLAGKQGWRVEIRGRAARAMDRLDAALWRMGPPESFLPHGRAGGPHDAAQPILLTAEGEAAPGLPCVICLDGAEAQAEEVQAAERVCILFDGFDEAAVQAARGQWKRLTGAGCAAQYWAQQDGRWTKKAEG